MISRFAVFGLCIILSCVRLAEAGPLHDAAKAGDVDQIKHLLAGGADINQSTGLATALYYAIQENHSDAAVFLIERGADVNAASIGGTPLHAASAEGLTTVVDLLLAHGADANARSKTLTPLHLAAQNGHIDVVRLLLDHGADLDAVAMFDQPPLHFAVMNGHTDIAALLLQRGTKAPPVQPIMKLLASADPARGKTLAQPCGSCHTTDRESKTFYGPPLWGIVGRPKASFGDYRYSTALKAVGGSWT